MSLFNPSVYWRRRHQRFQDIRAVGHTSWTVAENEIEYSDCQHLLKALLDRYFGQRGPESVLDFGYGQGHYAKLFLDMGIPCYVGLDFAAPELVMPPYAFHCRNICEAGLYLGRRFDVVLLLDVVTHIVNYLDFQVLLENVRRHAKGLIFITGLFHEDLDLFYDHVEPHNTSYKLERFSGLGRVVALYPWRTVVLVKIEANLDAYAG